MIIDDNAINGGGFKKGSGQLFQNPCLGTCGGWTAHNDGYRGDIYHTPADANNGPINQWAEWHPSLPNYAGYGAIYEVSVHVPNFHNDPTNFATSWQVPYVIIHADGTSIAIVSQRDVSTQQIDLSGKWISLGVYRLNAASHVYTHDATGEVWNQHCTGWCNLGVDAVKFVRQGTTYAPDIKQGNGWSHSISIRSNGGDAVITANGFKADGTLACSGHFTIPAHGRLPIFCASTEVASLVVDASQDVSVVVEQIQGQQTSAYTGIQSGGSGDANWGLVGTDLSLPYVYRSYYGYTSDLKVLNTGSSPTNITLTYCDQHGSNCNVATHNSLPAGGRLVVQPATANGFYGSARIQSSSQPVAVMADAYNTSIDISNQASAGVTTAHLPYVMKGYYGWDSCFVMRNLSSSGQNVTVVYHWSTGSHTAMQWVNGNAMWTSCQKDLPGSVPNGGLSATISASYPVAVAINQSHNADGKHMSYNATGQTGHSVILPILMKSHVRNGQTWASGYQVQNAGNQNTCPSVTYYSTTGTAVGPLTLTCIDPGKAVGLYLPNVTQLSNGQWSAVVTASQLLAGTANATCTGGCSGDTVYAYPAVTR